MKKTLDDFNFKGQKTLVRVDFNVPLEEGKITDDARIVAALDTIKYILDDGGSLILLSHLGRPKGQAKKEFSLEPVAKRLEELLGRRVDFVQSDLVVDDGVKEKLATMEEGEVVLLENTRYRKEEEANDEGFAKDLASLGDIYINDAFGTAHRAHASNQGLAAFLPSGVGRLVEKELSIMGKALRDPARPFVAILGGAKVSDKISVIENLLDKVDTILIGGGMAYTFLKAKGLEIGKSLLEEDRVDYAKGLLAKAEEKGVDLLLPVDNVVADSFDGPERVEVRPSADIPQDMMGMDIGHKTIEVYGEKIKEAGTVVWNGPMGVFEKEEFSKGTFEVARAMKECTGLTIVGGGDSALAVERAGYKEDMGHVSTGGGASLKFLEGSPLIGLEKIENKGD